MLTLLGVVLVTAPFGQDTYLGIGGASEDIFWRKTRVGSFLVKRQRHSTCTRLKDR
jgi:hypothetical protein